MFLDPRWRVFFWVRQAWRVARKRNQLGCGGHAGDLEVKVLYLLGWKAYFALSQTPKVWRELDEWIRHRLRAIQLKHWKRGATTYKALRALGASEGAAQKVARNARRWWRNSYLELNRVLNIAWSDRLGLPRLL